MQYNEGIHALENKVNTQSTKHLIFSKNDNLKPVKVTTLTATGYHSLIMFLLASDLSEARVGQEVWKIRDIIQVNK